MLFKRLDVLRLSLCVFLDTNPLSILDTAMGSLRFKTHSHISEPTKKDRTVKSPVENNAELITSLSLSVFGLVDSCMYICMRICIYI